MLADTTSFTTRDCMYQKAESNSESRAKLLSSGRNVVIDHYYTGL